MEFEQSPSYWMSRTPLPAFDPLKVNLEVDVGIIGGGISGLTTAYELTRRGISVALVDDGEIAGGESSRTTAHLTNALDDHYYILEQYLGKENARLAAESHRKAIDYIGNVCESNDIECGFERIDAYLFNPPGRDPDNLVRELNASKRAGVEGVSIVDQAPISSFNTGPSIKFPNQAAFFPIKYFEGLSELITKQGGKIYSHTHVKSIEEKNGHCRLITDGNFTIEAKYVVVATNSPINNPYFPHLKQASYRTYVIAGTIPKGYVQKALYYDTLDPYHYIRIVEESDHDLLIVGGEDHRVGMCDNPSEIYEVLEQWTKVRFPLFGPITHRWSGEIVEPIDCLAFIGRSKSGSNIFIATGDSGNGLTHGTIAGMLLSDLITQKPNQWEKLYDPTRKSLASLKDFLEETGETLAQYRDWVTEGDIHSEGQIKPDSGAILRQGSKKTAIYRSCDGKLHRLSAICPHLKGLVRWNDVEKSWDCPCHGSRFKATGEAINSPANGPLTKVDEKGNPYTER